MRIHVALSVTVLTILSSSAWGQSRKEVVAVFKDGFSVYGKVVEKRDFIVDKATGVSVTVPVAGGLTNLDDIVRQIYFVPSQLQNVEDKKVTEENYLNLGRYFSIIRPQPLQPNWQIVAFPDFDAKWERTLKVRVTNPDGTFPITQRIVRLTPQFMYIQTIKYDFDQFFLTRELGLPEVRVLVKSYLSDKKEYKDWKDWDKRKFVALFLHQAGWHKEAQKDLDDLVEEYPSRKADMAGLRENIKKILADGHVEDCERAWKIGQIKVAQDGLAVYDKEKLATVVNSKNQLLAADLKNKIETLNEKLDQTKTTLKAMRKFLASADRQFWTDSADAILADLNYDTLPRLETFLTFGQQHLREVGEKVRPSQTAEEVMALAVSGWLLGNSSAETDVKNARNLWRARTTILDYQKTVSTSARGQLLASIIQDSNKLPIDILARIIKNLPPPLPYDKAKINTETTQAYIDVEDSQGGDYLLRLPPEYNHNRPYPVLLVLPGTHETPETLVQRVSQLAGQNGYIVAAPLWAGKNPKGAYGYSAREHAIVLDTLRDLRRHFQVDSDRVFLFGFAQGANAALDIGMSHPDQFAGVVSMCGAAQFYTAEKNYYQSNAQYLPLYLVDGSRNGSGPANTALFKELARNSYPALYTEYKGRGPEWYDGELTRIFEWMSPKKRRHPLKEMGRYNTGVGPGEEFHTMRECDNRFYWLSTAAIDPRYLNNIASWSRNATPASLQAGIAVGNDLVGKTGSKEARIFTQFNIQAKGVRQLTLWLAPNMIDFTKPIRVRVNGTTVGNDRVIAPNPAVLLEDFFSNGDRQRLFYAKVDMKF